ncbi:hypothetical protein [Mitsuaria sp. GD03876]|uniref:hypothetical protein n=1 Tax=Mitsuaria sp. GD03876 TaxID=2975399 RepID=UPI0024475DEC|nr:hypothetical protein [Mitsuaria sp. GD03876]MDH0863506.1 hypothetical protein [Mitsuaria sp. GD03876]
MDFSSTRARNEALITMAEANTASPKTLAAESLVHAVEGWRFLAAAISSLISHGQKQSIHFAYYAELRAAVSILAGNGLRVKYPTSSYVEQGGSEQAPTWKREGTHKLVWRLWKDWTAGTDADSLFLDGLKVHPAIPLRLFKDAIAHVSAASNLAAWGRDLQLEHEHNARNAASYEAIDAWTNLSPMVDADFSFPQELWALAEPTTAGLQFEAQLVHWLLKTEAAKLDALQADSGKPWLIRVLGEVERLSGVSENEIRLALSLDSDPSPVFDHAFSPAVEAKNVIARAFFLLRIACLPLRASLSPAGAAPAQAWLHDWLHEAGVLPNPSQMNISDAWADYEPLISVDSPAHPLASNTLNDRTISSEILRLARPEAILVWSVCQ